MSNHPFFKQPGWKTGVFSGTNYHYLSIKSHAGKATFLLLHGFPTGAFTFKGFVPELTSKGYGIILPELKGYGKTDKPTDVAALAYKTQSDEIVQILDKEGVNKVILVGHDFGGALAPRFAQYYPDRATGLVLASLPYAPPAPTGLNPDLLLQKFKPILGYENVGHIKYFAHPDSAKELNENLETFVSLLYGDPAQWKTHLTPVNALSTHIKEEHRKHESWLSKEDKETIVQFLAENGLEGPTLWFKAATSEVNVAAEKTITSPRLTLPFLSISPVHEATYPPPILKAQAALAENFTIIHPDTGHWPFEQQPKEIAVQVLKWVEEKGISSSSSVSTESKGMYGC
ncbi:Alpha/Beta hydrolase protein [Cantharellus anzutake]|uniref:Alpha/Beta hydrolase protein n=1 Tax=Cantharellus anzutake TaxID=1750568 RepID=UPI0019066C51|nr:Alpha/Beta hydrolase protein [Cantharellus anzutake]KAF8335852.1 Alpha/Beta hydrolase protein [Cantharellus anzutake]